MTDVITAETCSHTFNVSPKVQELLLTQLGRFSEQTPKQTVQFKSKTDHGRRKYVKNQEIFASIRISLLKGRRMGKDLVFHSTIVGNMDGSGWYIWMVQISIHIWIVQVSIYGWFRLVYMDGSDWYIWMVQVGI